MAEGCGALLLPVDEEGQSVLVQVQQHAHSGPFAYTTFGPGKISQENLSPHPDHGVTVTQDTPEDVENTFIQN